MQKCLAFFPGVDRSQFGYQGLMAAQECLPNNEVRDAFAAEYSVLGKLWEAISPDPMLIDYQTDYAGCRKCTCPSSRPAGRESSSGTRSGEDARTHPSERARGGDPRRPRRAGGRRRTVGDCARLPNPKQKSRELDFKISSRLRKHQGNPKYRALSDRLEDLKARYEAGLLESVDFLKQLLALAKDLVAVEKETPPAEDEDRAKDALTELFQQVKSDATPVMVERIVKDIDDIVRFVRFPGWQQTAAGEREVKQGLRRTLLKYQLHQDAELFEKAYGYIKQYY